MVGEPSIDEVLSDVESMDVGQDDLDLDLDLLDDVGQDDSDLELLEDSDSNTSVSNTKGTEDIGAVRLI
ncbi:MAG TPA: hypothetical protein EYP80_01910 [Candidatus Aenigmarchaeota archaeon]|nr:hypothetical protein [Candidatus Aenigmarchaeota archaeon]